MCVHEVLTAGQLHCKNTCSVFLPFTGWRESRLLRGAGKPTAYSPTVTKHPFTGSVVQGKCRSPVKCAALWCINTVVAHWLVKRGRWVRRTSETAQQQPRNTRPPHRISSPPKTLFFEVFRRQRNMDALVSVFICSLTLQKRRANLGSRELWRLEGEFLYSRTKICAWHLIIHANKGHAVSFHRSQTVSAPTTLPAFRDELKRWEVHNYLLKLNMTSDIRQSPQTAFRQ